MNDNKFKIGDKVLYDSAFGMKKVDIFGYIYYEKDNTWLYAIKLPTNKHVIVREDTLSKLKKKDKLEVGDKFKCKTAIGKTNKINIVLAVAEDEKLNQVKYLAKRITGNWIGYVDVYNAELIDEIIYE
jgi:hypothetical protein